MLKTNIKFLLLSISGLTFAACSNNDHSKNLDIWTGNYNFEEEPIDGIIFFSADKKGRIFGLSCNWTLNADLVDTSGMETIDILNKFFPCLPSDFKGKKTFELQHKDFIEKFILYPRPDSVNTDHRYNPHWSLEYSVKSTK